MERQTELPVRYDQLLDVGYRMDLLIDGQGPSGQGRSEARVPGPASGRTRGTPNMTPTDTRQKS